MANLPEQIVELCKKRGTQLAFQMQLAGTYRQLTWEEYADSVLKFSGFLKSQGITAGTKVLLCSENGPEWTIAALAAMNCGAVLVPVASVASFLEIQNIILSAQPQFCIFSERSASIAQVRSDLKEMPQIIWDLQSAKPLAAWTNVLKDNINEKNTDSDTAILIFTSGTTGQPKAVPVSHGNILTNARDVLSTISVSSRERLVSVLPLSHMFEFTGGFVVPVLIGAQITYAKSLKPEDLLQAMRDTKATILIGVPLLFEVIARTLQARLDSFSGPMGLVFTLFRIIVDEVPILGKVLFFPVHKALGNHIRFFIAGGSRLQPQTFEFFKSLGILILQGYGLTETSPVLCVTNETTASPGHVGPPLPNVQLGIFNEQGKEVPRGEEGEIWAKGPSVFRGYLNPDHNKGAFSDGWFHTGDLGAFTVEGFLKITGRKNIYPEEIEGVVLLTEKFLEATVFGLTDEHGHEKVCLVIVPDRSKFAVSDEVSITKLATDLAITACRSLAEYNWPQRVEVLFQDLPKTITRKIKKHEVKKLILDSTKVVDLDSRRVLNLDDPLECAVGKGIESITKREAGSIAHGDALSQDLGLDSLTFVELVSSVEKELGKKTDGIDFTGIATVEDFIQSLKHLSDAMAVHKVPVPMSEFAPQENWLFLMRFPRRLFNVWLRSFLKIRHRMKVEGLEHLSEGGPYIFTPNHSSHFDMISIAGSVPGALVHTTFAVAAKDYFFNQAWKACVTRTFLNALPFDRKSHIEKSMELCREALNLGANLTIFPEGTRSPSGRLQKFKPGVGYLLAGDPKVKAVPVYIHGAYDIMPKGSSFPRRGRLYIRYGKPISFADLPATKESFKKIAETLEDEVKELGAEWDKLRD